MIFTAGIVITLFLCALLAFKKNKSGADKILLSWFVVILIHQLFFCFDHSGYLLNYTSIIGFDFPLPLMHGPFLFLYASALVNNIPRKKITALLHFIPPIACYIYLIPFYTLSPQAKLSIIANNGKGYEGFLLINLIAIITSGIIYVALTLLFLAKHQQKIKDTYSTIEKKNLTWLQYLSYGIALIWLTVIFGDDTSTFIAVVIFIMVIGFFGIKQTPIFTGNTTSYSNKNNPVLESTQNIIQHNDLITPDAFSHDELSVEKIKYQKSAITQDELQTLFQSLTNLMLEKKLFTNPELTLGQIAQLLNTHPNYLSQVINSLTGKNFYDYINQQRVQEFIIQLNDSKNQKLRLLALAHDCGFNSKTSFNRNFKKSTGLSPTQYLAQQNIKIQP